MLVDEIENAIDDIEFDKADAALERFKKMCWVKIIQSTRRWQDVFQMRSL